MSAKQDLDNLVFSGKLLSREMFMEPYKNFNTFRLKFHNDKYNVHDVNKLDDLIFTMTYGGNYSGHVKVYTFLKNIYNTNIQYMRKSNFITLEQVQKYVDLSYEDVPPQMIKVDCCTIS